MTTMTTTDTLAAIRALWAWIEQMPKHPAIDENDAWYENAYNTTDEMLAADPAVEAAVRALQADADQNERDPELYDTDYSDDAFWDRVEAALA